MVYKYVFNCVHKIFSPNKLEAMVNELITDLSQVKTRADTTIVIVAVHVQDLLAIDRQETRQNALGQASAENDNLQIS